ncbi:MAG: LamG domain-containing protein [Planctomycetota bacterium]
MEFRPTSLTSDARLVSFQAADNNRAMGLGRSGSGAQGWVRTSGTGGSGTTASGSGVWTANADHHAVVTYDGSELRLYADGLLVDTQTVTGDLSAWSSAAQFGLAADPDGSQGFVGRLTEVTVYDTPATDDDVRDLAGLAPLTASGGMTVRWVELD